MSKIDIIQIRIDTRRLDPFAKNVMSLVEDNDADELPFDLPVEVNWPTGSRNRSARALLLMKIGLESLQNKYPLEKVGSSESKKNETKKVDETLEGWD